MVHGKEMVPHRRRERSRYWNLYDRDKIYQLFKDPNFDVQKRGLSALISDKPFYKNDDVAELEELKKYVQETFLVRGQKVSKQGFMLEYLLSRSSGIGDGI